MRAVEAVSDDEKDRLRWPVSSHDFDVSFVAEASVCAGARSSCNRSMKSETPQAARARTCRQIERVPGLDGCGMRAILKPSSTGAKIRAAWYPCRRRQARRARDHAVTVGRGDDDVRTFSRTCAVGRAFRGGIL